MTDQHRVEPNGRNPTLLMVLVPSGDRTHRGIHCGAARGVGAGDGDRDDHEVEVTADGVESTTVDTAIPRCACSRFGYSGFSGVQDGDYGWHTYQKCVTTVAPEAKPERKMSI